MPSISIGEGIEFYYEDSGPVKDNSHYTTLVFVHGIAFHGGMEKRNQQDFQRADLM